MSQTHCKKQKRLIATAVTQFDKITVSKKALEEWYCSHHCCSDCHYFNGENNACNLYGFLKELVEHSSFPS